MRFPLFLWLICSLTIFVYSNAWEVYLREITLYKTHESSIIENSPEAYFSCDNDRARVNLYEVQDVNKTYTFNSEQVPITHLSKDECVVCILKEADLFDNDDVFGSTTLCTKDFKTSERTKKSVSGEYDAVFECPQCYDNYESSQQGVQANQVRSRLQASGLLEDLGVSPDDHSLSNGMITFLCIACFITGIIVTGITQKVYKIYQVRKEIRQREINYMLSNSEVPFEEIPSNGSGIQSQQTLPTSYRPVSVSPA